MEKKMQTSPRNGEIEILRFLFSATVVFYHSKYLTNRTVFSSGKGYFAVEFFFLLSGYLMMASVRRREKAGESQNLGRETVSFIRKKISSLYPEVAVAWVFAAAVFALTFDNSFVKFIRWALDCFINDVLLLKMTGITVMNSFNGVLWYVSTMLICMMLLYPLLRKYPDVMTHCLLPVICTLIIGYLFINYDTLSSSYSWVKFTYKGNLRGFSELGLGAVLYEITQWLRKVSLKKGSRAVLMVAKWGAYLIIFYWMFNPKNYLERICFLLLCAALVLTFSERCPDTEWYNHKVSYFLGRFSLPLYLSHQFYAFNLDALMPDAGTETLFLAYIVCSLATAAAVMVLSRGIRRILANRS